MMSDFVQHLSYGRAGGGPRSGVVVASAMLACLALHAAAHAGITGIAHSGDAPPEGNGQFGNLLTFSLTDEGLVVFGAGLDDTADGWLDDRGLYLHDGASLVNLARTGDAVPEGGGTFDFFGAPVLGAAGQVAFTAALRDTVGGFDDAEGVYVHDGSTLSNLARADEIVPEGGGRFSFFSAPQQSAAGHVAFRATLDDTPGGFLDDTGLYVHDGNALTNLVRTGDATPGGDGDFDWLNAWQLGGGGHVAFNASLRDTAAGGFADEGLYRHDGSALIELARNDDAVPEGGGQFEFFAGFDVNDAGHVAFRAELHSTSGGHPLGTDNGGIYLHDGAALNRVVRGAEQIVTGPGEWDWFVFHGDTLSDPAVNAAGQVAFDGQWSRYNTPVPSSPVTLTDHSLFRHDGGDVPTELVRQRDATPEGDGYFGEFSSIALLAGGQALFTSAVRDNPGDTFGGETGVYLADGVETVKVVRSDDTLAGGTITSLGVGTPVNDHGQVLFQATVSDGEGATQGLFLFTPELRWRAAGGGDWDASSNWTLSLAPGQPHHVAIDPGTTLTVAGPADHAAVRSLTVGGGAADATLALQAAGSITAADTITTDTNGTITGPGLLATPLLVNHGTVQPGTPGDTLTLDGDFEQSAAGVLDIDLGETGHNALAITGSASLAGSLDVELIGNPAFTPGQAFEILTASAIVGMFDSLDASLPDDWSVQYTPDSVLLRTGHLLGDMNLDGVIDAVDVAPFVLALTNPAAYTDQHGIDPLLAGDINADGVFDAVDVAPFVQLLVGGGPAPAAIPEPTSLALLGMALALATRRRR
ncbi:MAG: choice-of-anchor tandem repeat NxxGxxAF-containing protein [Phycisphaeraceae bacterium]